ncbi:ABC transporter ATP-binding protein [Microvirga antarctica]|uniref:ABC transporter ATP-binding protein n=1 Tax=Microvirga antarctica TaxID=2819233 RepID=UPI001B305EFB|nr:ABC transporter ATP-binding protein [Microvirga antarctica]
MSNPILQVRDLARSFGALRAVDGINLSVQPATMTGLIGPNGAGKSTLFGLIAGALKPDTGEIVFADHRIDGLSPDRIFRTGLARTFQIPRPFPKMTVLDNVMLAALDQAGEKFWNNWFALGTVRKQEKLIRDRAMEVLGFTGLAAKVNDFAGQLSGGQQKLLELARVLMTDPQLILLDEPAAGVNPALLDTLIDKIIALHARGVGFLIIEHNMDMVMSICNPIVVMAQGRVIFEGDADGVRADQRVLDAYLGGVEP